MNCVTLQATIEGLQMELGKKDSQINQLQNEKSGHLHQQRQMQREIDNLQTKLLSVEAMESTEVKALTVNSLSSNVILFIQTVSVISVNFVCYRLSH